MSETEKCKISELDKLLLDCKSEVDLDKTIGFKRNDLTEEQVLIEKLGEKNTRVVKLLEELVRRQKRDDKSARFVSYLNMCTTKIGMAIGAGILLAFTYFSTEYIKAKFEKTPQEKQREQLILQMLEDQYGPIDEDIE